MSANSQLKSTFVTRLPREVRDAIYLELWRSNGLRQHIVSHRNHKSADPEDPKWHFCRWRCVTDFEVEDRLQQEIELLEADQIIDDVGFTYNVPYQKRLASPWHNHWACGEEIEKVHGEEFVMTPNTSGFKCWKWKSPVEVPQPKPRGKLKRFLGKVKHRISQYRSPGEESAPAGDELSPYIPLLLSCKLLSSECLKSLYESTTFVFTDILALETFVGVCQPNATGELRTDNENKPAGFLKYARNLELTLTPLFHLDVSCFKTHGRGSAEGFHNPYDFHWLKLDQFENLTSIKIWASAREFRFWDLSYDENLKSLHELDLEGLKNFFSPLANLQEVLVSSPLKKEIEPEDGFVEGITAQSSHRVWKRGPGDAFHPNMEFTYGWDRPHASVVRYNRRYVEKFGNPRGVTHVHLAMF